MPEETMTVTATPISPSGVDSGPSRPEDHLLQEFLLALLSRSHLVTVLLLPCRMNLSIRNSIPWCTTDGEMNEWVFVETSGKRILTDEGDITYVLQLLQNVGDSG
ncbi:hypothetical protein [Klebsiella michiganensis]|uniref:hypothetical protein n=1 Tax=Klebsiella michiganensis TaxID=1134687 RepID=UPI0038901BCC